MPWTAADAYGHTHKASTPALARLWAEVANDRLGRGVPEAQAIRQANIVVARASAGEGAQRGEPSQAAKQTDPPKERTHPQQHTEGGGHKWL